MSRLVQWLDHRMEVVGFDRWKDVAARSGLSLQALRDMRTYGTLQVLNRSERRVLATALRVALRKLEQLSDNAIDWIHDGDVYDAGGQGRPLPGQENDPLYWASQETKREDRGTPLVGRVQPSGKAEPDEDWQEEWGRRIPQRFGTGHNVYALEFELSGQSIVLRNIPPWEFRGGPAAVYSWNGWEAEGWFGRVFLQPPNPRVITPDGHQHDLDLQSVVRVGRLIGRPPAPTGSHP